MEAFITVENTLIQVSRLIAMEQVPSGTEYLAVFDTGQKLLLSDKQGKAVIEKCQSLKASKPSEGTIAITSDSAT